MMLNVPPVKVQVASQVLSVAVINGSTGIGHVPGTVVNDWIAL